MRPPDSSPRRTPPRRPVRCTSASTWLDSRAAGAIGAASRVRPAMFRILHTNAALSLAGCATVYENHIESKLVDAGLSPPVASCIADRIVDRLSRRQLD